MRLVKKRTTSLNEEQTATLFGLIEAAENRDKEFFDQCEKSLLWLQGDNFPTMRPDGPDKQINRNESAIKVNLAHAHVRSLVPSLFFREPTYKAWPMSPQHENSSAAWEDLLNAFVRRSDYKVRTKEVVLDSAVYPEAWKKWVVFKNAPEEINSGEADLDDLEDSFGSFSEIGHDGPNFWDNKFTIRGVRISPRDVVTDSYDRKPENSRFVAIKYRKLLSELVEDPRYEIGREELRAMYEQNKTTGQDLYGGKRHIRAESSIVNDRDPIVAINEEPVCVYEVWVYQLTDLKLYKQVVTLCEGCKLPIRQPTPWTEFNGPYLNTYPFNTLSLLPIPDSRGHSELAVFYSLQKTMNWIVSKIITQIDNRKQYYNFYPQNSENPKKAMNQFYSGRVREFLQSKQPGAPVIEQVPQQGATSDDFQLVTMVLQLIQHVTGMTTNRRGASGARTATEADIIESSAQIKMDEKADAVSDFIKRDGEIMVRIIRAFVNKDLVFRVTGNVGSVKWQQFTQDDAAWSPDVEVEPESFRRSVNSQRLQALMTMLSVLPNLGPALGPNFRIDVIVKRLLEQLEVPNPQEITGDDVPSEVKQMAELIQIILGLPAQVLPTDDHIKELSTLEAFITSEVYGAVPPEIQQIIEQHYATHVQLAQNGTSGSFGPTSTGNNFDDVAIRNGNPASEARQETAGARGQF